jgi:aminoglycoside phosphotransferase (APT) family kinase protein
MGVDITDPEVLHQRVSEWLPGVLGTADRPADNVAVSTLSKPKTGQSNETILFDVSWTDGGAPRSSGLVLRMQPRGNQMFVDADVAREGRLIQRLGEISTIALPRVLAVESDPAVLGAPFFLMSKVEGHVPAGSPSVHMDPWLAALTPGQRLNLITRALESLAAVHAVEVESISDILDPAGDGGSLTSNADRLIRWYDWARRARSFPVLDRAIEVIRSGLRHESGERVLLWGDPRPGNIIFADDGTVAAVLDWEIAGIGPAGLDVGWWLMMDEFAVRGAEGEVLAGLPTATHTVQLYENAAGRSVVDLDFFQLIAAVKLAITLIPAMDSLVARGILQSDTRFGHDNVPTQIVARLLGIAEPEICFDYRRLSRMKRTRQ